jgi:hypothetical protein
MKVLAEPRVQRSRVEHLSVAPENDLAHRLALWLADVSAEVALAAAAPQASPTPIRPARSQEVAGLSR